MNYECPACHLQWKDSKGDDGNLYHPLCTFCSVTHTQKELIDWQVDHLEHLNPKKFYQVIRHLYRFIDLELQLLKEKNNEGRDT